MSQATSTTDHASPRVNCWVLFVLWLVPMVVYSALIGRWSLCSDEYYTLVDSSKPVLELLSYERKPIYYLICHFLLSLSADVSLEFLLRFPAALAASLIAPVFYGMLHATPGHRYALPSAVIALANPWLMEMSQVARYYSLAFLFTTVAMLALFRWLTTRTGTKTGRWLVLYIVSGLLATLSHTPAGIVFPAGMLAVAMAQAKDDPLRFLAFLKRHGIKLVLGLGLVCVVSLAYLWNLIHFWLSAESGQFGSYSVAQILVALALFGGISGWALAVGPLLKPVRAWTSVEVFLATIVLGCTVPFLLLTQIGGGVAARYLMFCLPSVFVLAGMHWATISQALPAWGYRSGLAVGLLAFNLPYLASVASDGDHFDYRGIARALEAYAVDDPLVLASSHNTLGIYLDASAELVELGTFERGVPRELIQTNIHRAESEHRALLLVSKEDRTELTAADQAWLFERFALLRSIQSQRSDHRRYRMAIYQYRPSAETCRSAVTDVTLPQPATVPDDDPVP